MVKGIITPKIATMVDVLANIGLKYNIITQDIASTVIAMTMITTLITPSLLKISIEHLYKNKKS